MPFAVRVCSNLVSWTLLSWWLLLLLLFRTPGVCSFHSSSPSATTGARKDTSSTWLFSEPTASPPKIIQNINNQATDVDASSLLYAEHEKLLVNRGIFEASLMPPGIPLTAHVIKGSGGGGGGFGGGSSGKASKKALLRTRAKTLAEVLKEQGLVRIDNVLSPALADSIRDKVFNVRAEAEQDLASGKIASAKEVFANVLLTHNRRDMTLPFGPTWIGQTLSNILLESPIGPTMELLLGPQALLREWSCLMSDPGSQRQVVHPDTPWNPQPVLYTCFIALQDITLDMGPTIWLPQTHTQAIHRQFKDEHGPNNEKDQLLARTPNVLGLLPKGACAMFDSRLLHCGTSNQSSSSSSTVPPQSRALLYCSFQNPSIVDPGNPGSIRSNLLGQWTLRALCLELQAFSNGKPSKVVADL